MGSAFAIENVSWFSGAFAFAPLRLFGAANVGASLIATDNLLFGRNDGFFENVSHFQVSLGQFGVTGSSVNLSYAPVAIMGRPLYFLTTAVECRVVFADMGAFCSCKFRFFLNAALYFPIFERRNGDNESCSFLVSYWR